MVLWFSRRPAGGFAVAAVVLLGILGGCGSAAPTLLDESARAALHAQEAKIRSALGDRTQATAAVERFRTEVSRLRDAGELAAADARVLLAHADQIESRVRVESPLPTPTPLVIVEPPKAEPPQDEQKPGKSRGKGKKGGGHD